MSGIAVMDLPSGKMPLLHEGETTQAQLRSVEVHTRNYYTPKGIDDPKLQVAHALGCFRDHRVTDLIEIESERAAILALDFKQFMDKIRDILLPSDWERDLRHQVNTRRQGVKESFADYSTFVRTNNSLLINPKSHVDNARIRVILESNMIRDLADKLINAKADEITDFKAWLDEAKHIDAKRIRDAANAYKTLHEIAEDARKRDRTATSTAADSN
jgi:hypothetical protein